jgi:hypothetical protein
MWVLSTLLVAHVAACSIILSSNEGFLATCALKSTLSSEFGRKTGLANVCRSVSNTTCLALLLLDQERVKSLGYSFVQSLPPVEVTPEFPEAKDHLDLGFLPRVSRAEFGRVFSWAHSGHTVSNDGKVLFSGPLRARRDIEIKYDAEMEEFVIHRKVV